MAQFSAFITPYGLAEAEINVRLHKAKIDVIG